MAEKEVWITGVGLLSSLGEGLDAHWEALGAKRVNADEKRLAPYVIHPIAPVSFDAQIPKKGDQRQMETWQRIGTYAAGLALDSAGVKGNQEILSRMDMIIAAGGGERDLNVDLAIMNADAQGKLPPASGFLLSEPAIVAGIAKATLPNTCVAWDELVADYDRIRDCIESVFPDFSDYNERIRQPGGFRLPLPATERVWKTDSGKAEFLLPHTPAPNGGALLLTTIRSHDQYNTTIYGNDDRYRGVFGRRDVIFMSEEDLVGRNLRHGDRVDVTTALPGYEDLQLKGFTVVSYDIAPGSIAAYFPEANCLVPLAYQDKLSGTPAYKSVPVKIARHSTTEQR